MKVENKSNMMVIKPRLGYKLHNKATDTDSKVAYLPLGSSLDDWEEIYDEEGQVEIADKMEDLVEMLQAVCKLLNIRL